MALLTFGRRLNCAKELQKKSFPRPLAYTPEALQKKLQTLCRPIAHSSPQKHCTISFHLPSGTEKRSFSSISSSANANKIERGFLGERVTDLTFLELGFHKINGQNDSGQGLDGIFWHPQTNMLLLTESKCRNESKSAKGYLADDLSESKILDRIYKIRSKPAQKTILHHIDAHMGSTYRMAQRLLKSGEVESALAPLDLVLYICKRFPRLSDAPPAVQKIFLLHIFEQLNIPHRTAFIVTENLLSQTPRRL